MLQDFIDGIKVPAVIDEARREILLPLKLRLLTIFIHRHLRELNVSKKSMGIDSYEVYYSIQEISFLSLIKAFL